MRAMERQSQMSAYLEEAGYASLNDFVVRFGVSVSTVRRDLEEMQKRGIVKRTHGGAFHVEVREHPLDYARRQAKNTAEKAAIGELAASFMQDGEAVLLDGGTTTFEVALRLRGRPLQVVTSSLPIATLLSAGADSEVIFLGGSIMARTGVGVGRYAEDMLRTLNVRRAVIGTAGITKQGLFNANLLMVELEQLMIEAADEVMVVVDHTKFGRRSLVDLCDFKQIDDLVTDSRVGASWVELLRSRGVRVHLAEVANGEAGGEAAPDGGAERPEYEELQEEVVPGDGVSPS